jgi:hypothetical protein
MKTVWKYEFGMADYVEIEMPVECEILCVQMQGGQPCVWALANPNEQKIIRRFRIAGTGHPIGHESMSYVGTFQMAGGALVFHVFEVN